MSQDNKDSKDVQEDAINPHITFEVFETYYKANPELDNAEYYQAFPTVKPNVLRLWKSRARSSVEEPQPSADRTSSEKTTQTTSDQSSQKDDPYLNELIEHLKITTRVDPKILEGLDKKSQYKVLKNMFDQRKPDANMKVFTPAGSANQKLGIDQYLRIDEKSFREKGHGNVELRLPASKLFKPDESKKLSKYN